MTSNHKYLYSLQVTIKHGGISSQPKLTLLQLSRHNFFSKLLAEMLTYAEGMKQKLTIVVVVVLFVLGTAAGQDDDPVS